MPESSAGASRSFRRWQQAGGALLSVALILLVGYILGRLEQLILEPLPGDPDPANWPAVYSIQSGDCTATFVGPKTVIGALHCTDLAAGKKLGLRPVDGGDKLEREVDKCWYGAVSLDLVVCTLKGDDVIGKGQEETLGELSPLSSSAFHRLFIGGFGCTESSSAVEYNVGEAAVFISDHLLKTHPPGVLCDGDSGGPVYDARNVPHNPETLDIGQATRYVVGINSKHSKPHNILTSVSSTRAREVICKAVDAGATVSMTFSCP